MIRYLFSLFVVLPQNNIKNEREEKFHSGFISIRTKKPILHNSGWIRILFSYTLDYCKNMNLWAVRNSFFSPSLVYFFSSIYLNIIPWTVSRNGRWSWCFLGVQERTCFMQICKHTKYYNKKDFMDFIQLISRRKYIPT